MKLLVAVFASAVAVCSVSADICAQATVKAIDTYCKQIDTVEKRRKSPELIYANTANESDNSDKWRKFASEKALDKFREGSETYDIAYNWRSGGRLIASNFTHSSPSGDWVKYVNHCFRADGTVARVETDYRTFNGDFKVVRKRYFDTSGRHINSSVKYLDLQSGKPKAKGDGVMGDDPNDPDFYKTVKKLPYARLLPR